MWPSWSHKLKRDSSKKTAWCQSACQALCHEPTADAAVDSLPSGGWILYKGTLARNSRCSKRLPIDKADISTSVAVDQSVFNCLEEAVWSFTAMRADVDRHMPTSFSGNHCQFFELFGASQSPASKLASLRNCSAARELLLRDRKILLLEGQ
ncbi:UNVERIFIED_CONTAM: hypothetical protein NCL1_25673 [Trichonephila clavipes]